MNKKTVKIKKGDLLNLHAFFSNLNEIVNKYFIEMSIRNRSILDIEKEIFEKMFEKTEKEKEYLHYEVEIIQEYAIKTKTGDIQYPISIDMSRSTDFNTKLKELQNKYKDEFASINKKNIEENEELQKELELELYTVKFTNIPDNINSKVYQILRSVKLIEIEE